MKGLGPNQRVKAWEGRGERQIRGVPPSGPYRRAGVWRACCPDPKNTKLDVSSQVGGASSATGRTHGKGRDVCIQQR